MQQGVRTAFRQRIRWSPSFGLCCLLALLACAAELQHCCADVSRDLGSSEGMFVIQSSQNIAAFGPGFGPTANAAARRDSSSSSSSYQGGSSSGDGRAGVSSSSSSRADGSNSQRADGNSSSRGTAKSSGSNHGAGSSSSKTAAAVPAASASQAVRAGPYFYTTLLDTTNAYRARHHAPALHWSTELADEAAKWADQCTFRPDPNVHGGENIYTTSSTTGLQGAMDNAVQLWYKQVYMYDFKQPGHSLDTGAFTQLVWKSTTQMGCAARLCSKGITGTTYSEGSIVVCRYLPQGNFPGTSQFELNVLPINYKPPTPPTPPQAGSVPPAMPGTAQPPLPVAAPTLQPAPASTPAAGSMGQQAPAPASPALVYAQPVQQVDKPAAHSTSQQPVYGQSQEPVYTEPVSAHQSQPQPSSPVLGGDDTGVPVPAAPDRDNSAWETMTAPVPTPAAPVPSASSSGSGSGSGSGGSSSSSSSSGNTSGSSSSSAAPSDAALSYALATHNLHRKNHLANPLIWHQLLASGAAEQAAKCKFELMPSKAYSENIFVSLSRNRTRAVAEALEFWYNTAKDYDYSSPSYQESSYPFSQMVWRSTFALGCAAQTCSKGITGTLVLCRYAPPGNTGTASSYLTNVKPYEAPRLLPPANVANGW